MQTINRTTPTGTTIDDYLAMYAMPELEGCKLNVGDKVTYTNSYGVVFKGHKVLGFDKETDLSGEHRVFIDNDCFWSPVRVDSLEKE